MSISSTIKKKWICHILIWMRFYYDPSKGVTTANGKSHKPYDTLQQFRFSLFVGTLLPRDPVSYSIMVCQLSGNDCFPTPKKTNKQTIRVILINIVKSNVALVSLSCCNVTKKSFHVKLGGMLTWFAEGFCFYYICVGIKDKLVDHTNG